MINPLTVDDDVSNQTFDNVVSYKLYLASVINAGAGKELIFPLYIYPFCSYLGTLKKTEIP